MRGTLIFETVGTAGTRYGANVAVPGESIRSLRID